jgi:hypothetical protein
LGHGGLSDSTLTGIKLAGTAEHRSESKYRTNLFICLLKNFNKDGLILLLFNNALSTAEIV